MGTQRMATPKVLAKDDLAPVWTRYNQPVSKKTFLKASIETYSAEDALLDALDKLPTTFMSAKLVCLLRTNELRTFAEGMLNDYSEIAKVLRSVECANVINSWVATAEEMISSRRVRHHILAARDKADALAQAVE